MNSQLWKRTNPLCRKLCGLVAAGFISTSSLVASTSAVVGFYNVPVPSGNSSWVSGLVGADLYQGAAVSVTADTDGKALVQFSAPGWTGGEFTLHYAEPQSGICRGLAIDVMSNTTDTLKLNSTPAAAGLVNGMVFTLRKHATLAGLLPDGGGFVPFSDTLSIFGSNGLQTTYFFSGSQWITVLGANSNNVMIRPGQGFVIQSSSAKNVTLGKGEISYVKSTPTKLRANANVPNLMGALNPLGSSTSTLGALGLTASLQAFNDSVVTLSTGALTQTGTYLSNGSGLINSGNGQSGDNVSIGAGASVVINVNAAKNISLAPVSVSP